MCVCVCVLASCLNMQHSLQPQHTAVCSDQSDGSVQFRTNSSKCRRTQSRNSNTHPSLCCTSTLTRQHAHTLAHAHACIRLLLSTPLLPLFVFFGPHTPSAPLFLFHSSPPCLTRSSLLSSPLLLFLFPLRSLMLRLSRQIHARRPAWAGPCELSIIGCWPMGAENRLPVMFCSELQEAGGGV